MDLHLKILFNRYQEQFGCGFGLGPGSGACLMGALGIAPNLIKSVFRASASLYRTEPWKRLRPEHLFSVKVGKDSDWCSGRQPFPCVQFIGASGGDVGFYMFRTQTDARKMTGSKGTIRVPNVEVLRVTFEVESLMFPCNRKMIKSLSLEGAGNDRFPVVDVARCTDSSCEVRFRSPSVEELKFVYGFMKGMSLLHPLLQVEKDGGQKFSRLLCFEPFIETVDVQWPPEMAKAGNDLVAVTISHPPGQTYDERATSTASSTPTKYMEPPKEGYFLDVGLTSHSRLMQCALYEEVGNGDRASSADDFMQ